MLRPLLPLPLVLGGSRPLWGLRYIQDAKKPILEANKLILEANKPIPEAIKPISEANKPTPEAIKPTQPTRESVNPTKDRLDFLEREMALRTSFETLNAGYKLFKWELGAVALAMLTLCSVLAYFVQQFENHLPASVISVLVERNLLIPPAPSPTEAPAPAPSPSAK